VIRQLVALTSDVPPGGLLRVEVAGHTLCVAHAVDGSFYALEDECPHEQAWLSEGELEGCEIECPLHYSRFDLRTGEVRSLPATMSATTYHVEVEGRDVYVNLPV